MKVSERKVVERVREHADGLLNATSYAEEYLERTKLAEAIADLIKLGVDARDRQKKRPQRG